MCESRKVAPTPSPGVESGQKLAPEKYFSIIMTILLLTGMYPISSERSFVTRFLYSTYFWCGYIFLTILNPISKAIALPYLTNLDDLTDNISLVINHGIAAFKIAVFMIRRKDLFRLVATMEGRKFRHRDCSQTFSANRLISEAVRTSQATHCIFILSFYGMMFASILSAIFKQTSEEISEANGTNFAETTTHLHRALPFHGWYPFSTQTSPNYEIVFIYQIFALFFTGHIVLALDALIFSFMIHIRVQFRILSHNLRFIKSHSKNRWRIDSASATTGSNTFLEYTEDQLTEAIELNFERQILHHRTIIQVSQDLESVFTYQLLVQFICSLLAICLLMWQVSSTPVFSTRFASMLAQLAACAFQLFIYCWFGNEIMLESLSIAKAVWDSGWDEISSRRYCYGVAMMIQRSQKVIIITAGGFAGLTLETFMTISRAAYSCFALLKKMDG